MRRTETALHLLTSSPWRVPDVIPAYALILADLRRNGSWALTPTPYVCCSTSTACSSTPALSWRRLAPGP
ncbi:hypothetical protein LT493_11385 [Streptomyces tricolor]|nr:hypothetical protein [Streptomyces tricolor]